MSGEIDPIHYGQLTQKVENLTHAVAEIKALQETMSGQIGAFTATLNKGTGAIWMAMAMGTFFGWLSSIVSSKAWVALTGFLR